MSAVESAIIFLPRPTTLIGATSFRTLALDVSRFGSFQLQLWRGPIRGGGTYLAYFEESLDTETWVLGPSTPQGYDPANGATGGDPSFVKPQLFSYAFRLRWFRMRFELANAPGVTAPDGPMVTTWAEGFLRDGGGGGAWAAPAVPRMTETNVSARAGVTGAAVSSWRPGGEVTRPPAGPLALTESQLPSGQAQSMAEYVAAMQTQAEWNKAKK